jgi:chemotaxis protein methyltransferase CheR
MTTLVDQVKRPPHRGLELLRDLVHEHTGLYFDDSKIDLFFAKLSPRIVVRASGSIMDFYYILKDDSGATDEWPQVFDALTVQESYFWREMEQIRALVDVIVPQYFNKHPDETLNIWSAACAGGCEPLTIAMALNEAAWFDRAEINIHASDASPRAIEGARKGMYREHTFRRLPPSLREKYFVRSGGAFAGGGQDGQGPDEGLSRVSSQLYSRVRWKTANLMSEGDLALAPMASPVIFCRNVFIYFSQSAAGKTVQAFATKMPRPGYLFLGMAESLMKDMSDFEALEIGGAFVHVRS